jgi:hypothetical protein
MTYYITLLGIIETSGEFIFDFPARIAFKGGFYRVVMLHTTLLGRISCQFLPPVGSMGSGYDLQLLYSKKSQNC